MGKIILPDNTLVLPTTKVEGLYRLRTHKYKSGKLHYDTGWFKNIITDVGLIDWFTSKGIGGYDAWGSMCAANCVGTGSAAPTTSDVQLAAYLASSGPKESGGGTGFAGFDTTGYVAAASPDPAYWYGQSSWQYGTGVAAGNLTEVGVFPGNPGGTAVAPYYIGHLFSRALILDSNGNPTTITVLSDEILTVTWQLRFYLDLTDHTFTFNLNGAPITGVYRMFQASTSRADYAAHAARDNGSYGITAFSGDIVSALVGQPTGDLGGINSTIATMTVQNFVNDLINTGTCYCDCTVTAPIGKLNGTIASFSFIRHMWTYQFGQLSQPIIKTNGQQLQMGFRTAWGRYSP